MSRDQGTPSPGSGESPESPDYRAAFHRTGRTAGEVDAEFAFHLETRIRELVAQGWEPAAARTEALRRFGDLEDARRYCEQSDRRRTTRMLRLEYIRELGHDVAYALRSLRRMPAFTTVALITLALGVGANTSIFSVVRGVLLRPLPFRDPDAIVSVRAAYQGGRLNPFHSPANLADINAQNHTLAGMAWFTGHAVVLTGAGDPERVVGSDVSADMFSVLGVRPVVGRITFTPAEDAPNGPKVVLMREGFWRSHFGGDTTILSRTITLDNAPYQVLGIVPEESAWPGAASLWFPIALDQSKLPRGAVYVQSIARLKPTATVPAAAAEVRDIAKRLASQYPDDDSGLGGDVIPLREAITGSLEQPLLIMLGAVTFVLLIACANVANLLLVRGATRAPEIAVRAALGAGRGRIIRQVITESVVLSVAGAALGFVLSIAATSALVKLAPAGTPRLGAIHVDGLVLAFTTGVAVLTGLVFGLLPARQVARTDLNSTLREGGRGLRGTAAASRLRSTLVVAEVALAVMLVVGAGLLVRSFRQLMDVDPGFKTDHTLTFTVNLPQQGYGPPDSKIGFANELTTRLAALPGVRGAGIGLAVPLTSFSFDFTFTVTEHPPLPPKDQPDAQMRVATPGYFSVLGIPAVKGRLFTEDDRRGASKVTLITEAAAAKFFPGEDPVGKHVQFGWGGPDGPVGGEIVGVVRDVKPSSLAEAPVPQFYVPFAQRPMNAFSVVVRTATEPTALVASARAALKEIDPRLAMAGIKTMETVVDDSVAQPRFYMTLLTAFAAVALVLAAVGIYGVIAYLVGQRTREIGIRIALGASRAEVVRMVLRQGATMAGTGIVIGVAGALVLTRFMERLLFHTQPTDLPTYGLTVMVLGAAAVLASLIPAVRASRADPVLAMRAE